MDATWTAWLDRIETELRAGVEPGNQVAYQQEIRVASAVADSLAEQRLLCELISVMASTLERNISVDFARTFKRRASANTTRLADLVRAELPQLSKAATEHFAGAVFVIVAGLWPYVAPTEAVAIVTAELGVPTAEVMFPRACARDSSTSSSASPPAPPPTDGTPAEVSAPYRRFHRRPARRRLAHWSNVLGVRPEHLTELDGGASISQDIRDGIVTLPHPEADPLTTHLNRITAGVPGARLVINTAAPDAPAMTDLIRLAHGLHLAAAITIENHRLYDDDPLRIHGERWQIDLVPPDQPPDPTPGHPHHQSLPAAVAHCLAYLELALAASVPTDPHQPIPSPQTPDPGPAADPAPLIRQLGHHHAGHPVTVQLTRAGCRVYLAERGGTPTHLATAPTLTTALASLGLDTRGT